MAKANAQIQREAFPAGTSSATRCSKHPVFVVRYETQKGPVERRYCGTHGYAFAKSNGLRIPPKGPEEVERMDLSLFTDAGLDALRIRTQAELARRSELRSHVFEFDETGHKTCVPYAARLKPDGQRLGRYFFPLKKERYGTDEVRIHGTYGTFPGAIIEKRLGGVNGAPAPWLWFLIDKDGQEILLGEKDSAGLMERMPAYLQGRISVSDLLAGSKG